MNGLQNDYMYQQAMRRRRNVPPEVSATPSLRDVTAEYAARKAQQDAQSVAGSQRANLDRLRLAENARRFNVDIGMEREYLGDARRAGMIASGIELAGLAGTGLAAVAAGRRSDRQLALNQEAIAAQRKALDDQQKQHQAILKLYREMVAKLAG